MPDKNKEQVLKSFTPKRIMIPILIGLAVATYMVANSLSDTTFCKVEAGTGTHVWVDENNNSKQEKTEFILNAQGNFTETTFIDSLNQIDWSFMIGIWLFVALIMMFVRDFSYMYRIRILTGNKLTWRQSFDVIMLWEFSSAVSPSVVGGVAPAIYFLYKEGISTGKSSAITLIAIFFDELFFSIMVPILYFTLGHENIFGTNDKSFYYLLIGYSALFLYTLVLAYALFINPYSIKKLLSWVFLLPILRKWRLAARKAGNQLIMVSNEMKDKSIKFWLKVFISTFTAWTGRYWVVNFLFIAFFASQISWFDHLLVYARQLTMWIIMLISPTPGASGIAEYIFKGFLGDLIPNLIWAAPLAILWRLISYYPYLFIGSIVLPNWIKRTHKK